jgi:hypothetical protein
MTNVSISEQLVELGEVTPAVMPVAVLRLMPADLAARTSLAFQDGFDDLDYLVFSKLQLPSGKPATLVRHQNSPNPGTEICAISGERDLKSVVLEVLQLLNLTTADLSWVYPGIRPF